MRITTVGQALDHLRTDPEFQELESKSLVQTLSIQEFHSETYSGWIFELTVNEESEKFFVGQDGQIDLLEVASVVGTHRLIFSNQPTLLVESQVGVCSGN